MLPDGTFNHNNTTDLRGRPRCAPCFRLPGHCNAQMHQSGIAPGSHRWQRCVLPIDSRCECLLLYMVCAILLCLFVCRALELRLGLPVCLFVCRSSVCICVGLAVFWFQFVCESMCLSARASVFPLLFGWCLCQWIWVNATVCVCAAGARCIVPHVICLASRRR